MTDKNWHIVILDEVGSTNDEAQKYCSQKGKRTVVAAKKQTMGRGRRGRVWQSLSGNLFFSAAIEFPLSDLGKLVIISSLSVLKAIKKLQPEADVGLKWPNDVLLGGKKVCGMLLEKAKGDYIIIGIGVNIKQSPLASDIMYPATSLAENGIAATAEEFLHLFLQIFSATSDNLSAESFAELRKEWEQNAYRLGQKIEIRQNDEVKKGLFLGIDADGGLLLKTGEKTEKFMAGDVFYIK